MRKFYLFFAGAMLLSLPASSQLKFERHPEDARIIFEQDFEATEGLTDQESYIEWSTTPIDTILELEYYAKLGSSTPRSVDIYAPENAADWSIFMVRKDSVSSEHPEASSGVGIVIFNGVETSSSASEKANGVYNNDSYTIVNDGGNDADRNAAFAQYGETGGKSFFKYSTGGIDATKISSSHYSTDTRSTKNYRRDLYVRGLDIEDESSYRLTFYIKTKKLNTWGPLFYADLMRGYHHQRAPFSMGYKSGKDFSFSMDEFEDGQWQKVTVMNYYLNGREADGYVIYKGDYSWTDDWTWRPSDEELAAAGKTLAPGEVLNYVKQPDKFFIRFSFATDSVEYSLDNLTLTKSWIGGCEYYGDKLRVNFGYDTNLDDIVKAEKEATNIPAVEIPNLNGKYFEVWCQKDGVWSFMPIRSAEYHDDGYMYLFTQDFPIDPEDPESERMALQFGDYDSVFVSFHNPKDMPELTLKYTGNLYPKALDTAWVNAGKIVPDFYNELAVPNPSPKIWKGVVSLDGLAPVMTKAPYEDGAFGLDPKTTELRFKFQKEVKLDKEFKGEVTENLVAYVGEEVWIPSWDDATKELIITRPEGLRTNDLKGDYLIHLIQIKGVGGDAGADVIRNYHFGDFDTRPADASEYTHSDWRSTLTDPSNNEGCVPVGVWTHCYYNNAEQFEVGAGQQAEGKVRLYVMDYTNLDNCGFYLASRNTKGNSKAKYSGNIFTIVNFTKAGGYSIKFKVCGWDKTTEDSQVETHFYLYPKPAGDVNSFDFSTFTSNDVVATKTDLGAINATTFLSSSTVKDVSTGKWPEGVETPEYTFNIPAPGDYVFEWCIFDGNSSGLLIGNYTIGTLASSDLSTAYVKKLINAVDAANAKLATISADKYKGPDYNALSAAAADGDIYKGNFPSQYDSVVAYINSSLVAMNLRVDTVDQFYKTDADVIAKLAEFTGDSAKYQNLDAYKALKAHKDGNAGWIDSVKTTREIALEMEAYKAEIKALDNRMALIDQFNDDIKATQTLINAKDARSDYEEYDDMVAGCNAALAFDVINCPDSVLTDANNKLLASRRGYIFRFDYEIAMPRQVKELFALADTLGYNFGGKKDSIKAYVSALTDDDPELSAVLREAAILQILKIYQENNPTKIEKMEGFDVSVLIPNYFMRNNATVDVDIEKSSSGVWRIKRGGVSTAIPGWTVTYSSGTMHPGQTTMDWELDGHVFIDGVHFEPNTTGTVGASVEGLPQAYYSVSLEMFQNNVSNSKFNLTTSTDTVEVKGSKFAAAKVVAIADSVRLVDGSNLDFSYSLTGASGSGHVGVKGAIVKLVNPDDQADYKALVTAQENKLNGLITFVSAPVQNESVEYYNLGGMKINNPKSGEIIIRKTTKNGKVVVDKVLIK